MTVAVQPTRMVPIETTSGVYCCAIISTLAIRAIAVGSTASIGSAPTERTLRISGGASTHTTYSARGVAASTLGWTP